MPDRIRISPEAATARGLELSVTSASDAAVQWWVVGTWARAFDRIAGRDVPRSWDQTRAFGAGVSRDTPRWNVALAAAYRTGWPTTPVTFVAPGEPPIVVAGPRNSTRVGAYRTVDFRVTRKFSLRGGTLAAFVEVSNALDQRNWCCAEYEVEIGDAGVPVLDTSQLHYLPLVPSLGVVSVSYTHLTLPTKA